MTTIDDVLASAPVTLTLELGEIQLTGAELRALKAGGLIETTLPVETPVTLRINARKVGEGRLVDVDGHLGVQLLEVSVDEGESIPR